MKKTLLVRAAASLALVITSVVLPISPSFAGGGEGVTDTGGGANGGTSTQVVDPGKGGTPVVCKNGKGSWNGNDNYYVKGYPGCIKNTKGDPKYKWMAVVVRCVVGYDEFRFYGTVSNPTAGATLSRVNSRDVCLPANVDGARTYFPNPKDAGSVDQSIWRVSMTSNTKGQLIHLSDNCRSGNATDVCTPTSLTPRVSIGKSCTDLMAQGELSAAQALNSPRVSAENKAAIRRVVLAQYKKVLSNASSAWPKDLATSLANLPTSRLGTSVGVSSEADVTSLGNGYACSSAIQYIPVTDEATTDPVQIGACIAPIYVPARVFRQSDSSWPRSVAAVESFIDGATGWTPGKGDAPYAFALTGDWAVYNDLRYSTTTPQVRNASVRNTDPSVANSVDVPSSYATMIKNLVKKDDGDMDAPIATRDWFPEKQLNATGFEVFSYQSPTLETAKLVRMDRTNAANDAAEGSACWSMRVAASFDPTLIPPTTATPSGTSTSTQTNTPPNDGNADGGPTGGTGSSPAPTRGPGTPGPVQVVVTVNPKIYTVGGTSRPQSVSVTDVDIMCGSHACGAQESDPMIVGTPQGRLGLIPTGGYEGCVKTTQRGCDMYISKAATGSNIAGQSTTAMFFSPSRTGEAATVTISNEYLKVVPKKWIPPVPCPPIPKSTDGTPVEVEPCTPTPGYWAPDWSRAYIVTEYVVRTTDGGSLSRPVTGTIGK